VGKIMRISVLLVALFLGLILLSSAVFAGITKVKISEATKRELIMDPPSAPHVRGPTIPLKPGLTLTSPGQMVGTTHYDQQTNCSTGNRIAKDTYGNIHLCWMNGVDVWTDNRWIYYNFRDAASGSWNWASAGIQVNPPPQGDGYTNLSVLSDGRPMITYHSSTDSDWVVISVDDSPGYGVFTECDVRDDGPGPYHYIWPYETIDRRDRIHIISCESFTTGTPQRMIYTRSDDEANTWIEPELWDTLMDISGVLTSSRVSDKVAIAFTHPRDLEDPNQYNNDMCYYESPDGVTWDFNGGMINVTNYQTLDTLRAYCDCEAVYDYSDNLHLLWNTPYYDEINGLISTDACMLWHWSEATGITYVANGWWPSAPSGWDRSICKMSLGVDEENTLFALWTQFTDDDNSQCGWSNGELYMSYSTDGGATWIEPINITNSPTPDCEAGECDSDHWSTLAETVDDSLYIIYINDKDAGSISKWEGVDTENPVMYLAILNRVLTGGEEQQVELPMVASLEQNYPNPFNTSTNISYSLEEAGEVRLEVYDISGRRVATLADGYEQGGEHSVSWNGPGVSSGVYFYRLSTADYMSTKKMHLLK
jgi:hypothetical protein